MSTRDILSYASITVATLGNEEHLHWHCFLLWGTCDMNVCFSFWLGNGGLPKFYLQSQARVDEAAARLMVVMYLQIVAVPDSRASRHDPYARNHELQTP